jgi:hypothetical protein
MARVGNRGETHVWFDGEFWFAYTERLSDIRRFEEWFGAPTRRGRDDAVAWWDQLPKDALRVRKRSKRPGFKPKGGFRKADAP